MQIRACCLCTKPAAETEGTPPYPSQESCTYAGEGVQHDRMLLSIVNTDLGLHHRYSVLSHFADYFWQTEILIVLKKKEKAAIDQEPTQTQS